MKNQQSTYLNKVESLIDLAGILENEGDYQQILQLVSQKAAIYFQSDCALIMMINPQTHQTVKTIYSEGESGNRDKNHIKIMDLVTDKNPTITA